MLLIDHLHPHYSWYRAKPFFKKSISIANCPAFRSSSATYCDWTSAPRLALRANRLPACSVKLFFQLLIWLGCTPCFWANSAIVASFRSASRATRALKLAVIAFLSWLPLYLPHYGGIFIS